MGWQPTITGLKLPAFKGELTAAALGSVMEPACQKGLAVGLTQGMGRVGSASLAEAGQVV